MRIAASSPQTGMPHLILGEVPWYVVSLQMTDAAMTECVHTGRRDAKPFANRLEHLPHDIVVLKGRSVFRLKDAAGCATTKMCFEHLGRARIDEHVPIALLCLGAHFQATPDRTPYSNDSTHEVYILDVQARQFPGT